MQSLRTKVCTVAQIMTQAFLMMEKIMYILYNMWTLSKQQFQTKP